MLNTIATKGNYRFCEYEGGLYTVDKITKSVGMTVKAGFDREEVKAFFDGLENKQ